MSPRWVTVLDMVNLFHLPDLTFVLERLTFAQISFTQRRDTGHGSDALTQREIEMLRTLFSETIEYCRKVGFENAQNKAATLSMYLENINMVHYYNVSAITTELLNVHSEVMKDVFRHRFVQVSGDLTKYLDMQYPFGEDVSKAFPSATADLKEAGNCLAVGCNAAMAYHLMRAAEVGLWELGRDRQIPLAQNNKIEFAQWGDIIRETEIAIQAIQQWPNSRIKEDAHKFYNKLIVEVRAFNDGWRRHSAHARPHQPPMQPDEALALWGHVSRLMTTLASKIGEGVYTPLVWT